MNYQQKYLKYKNKYINLKKQLIIFNSEILLNKKNQQLIIGGSQNKYGNSRSCHYPLL